MMYRLNDGPKRIRISFECYMRNGLRRYAHVTADWPGRLGDNRLLGRRSRHQNCT